MPWLLYLRETTAGTPWIGGWVGPRAGCGGEEKNSQQDLKH